MDNTDYQRNGPGQLQLLDTGGRRCPAGRDDCEEEKVMKLVDIDDVTDVVKEWSKQPLSLCNLADLYERLRKIPEKAQLPDEGTTDDLIKRTAQKKGKWIENGQTIETPKRFRYECSECGEAGWNVKGKWYYCPNCGADMRGE